MRKPSFIEIRLEGISGYSRHAKPEINKLKAAINGLLYFWDITPEKKQPAHPKPIIKNEKPAICSIEGLLMVLNNKSGTQVQKA